MNWNLEPGQKTVVYAEGLRKYSFTHKKAPIFAENVLTLYSGNFNDKQSDLIGFFR